MARFVIFFAFWLFLAGCQDGPQPIRGTGLPAAPPEGWLDYCDRHPEDKDCVAFLDWAAKQPVPK